MSRPRPAIWRPGGVAPTSRVRVLAERAPRKLARSSTSALRRGPGWLFARRRRALWSQDQRTCREYAFDVYAQFVGPAWLGSVAKVDLGERRLHRLPGLPAPAGVGWRPRSISASSSGTSVCLSWGTAGQRCDSPQFNRCWKRSGAPTGSRAASQAPAPRAGRQGLRLPAQQRLVSVEKEEAVGDINLVLLLQGERRCSRTAALKLMCAVVEECTNRFIALERGLPALAESLRRRFFWPCGSLVRP